MSQQLIGRKPEAAGLRDADHVCMVSLTATRVLSPGERIVVTNGLTCLDDDGSLVVDPFGGPVSRGELFWAMVDPKAIKSVAHVWEARNGATDFASQTAEQVAPATVPNKYIKKYADDIGVTYEQLMSAAKHYVHEGERLNYPGKLSIDVTDKVYWSDFWYEWANETGHQFEAYGSYCCPEVDYPTTCPFRWV